MTTRIDNARTVRAPRGSERTAKSWLTEAPLRMLMNNLDPDVAEKPGELVVYGGIGRAARNWECFDRIVAALRDLEADETLLVQSGKPVGVFRTHADAPRVLIANSNLVPHWATWEHFNELDRKGLMMFGQMTAGSWIYIGSQGIVQGTYETFVEMARQHYGGSLAGRWILTAGLGGMGGAQPMAATMAGASCLAVECRPSSIEFRLRTGYLDREARDLDEALSIIQQACEHFALLASIVRDHDGAVVKTIGDAVMASFGDPAQAVKAALAMQKRIVDHDLVLKLGIHAGPSVVVNLNDRLDYFGSTVNMAARLQGQSEGGDIVLSRAIADDPAVRPLLASMSSREESVLLKGFADPIPFVRLLGV